MDIAAKKTNIVHLSNPCATETIEPIFEGAQNLTAVEYQFFTKICSIYNNVAASAITIENIRY